MKINSRFLRAIPLAAYVIAIAVTVLQSAAYALSYEAPKANYFTAGEPLPIIATVLALLGTLGGIALLALLPKKTKHDVTLPTPLASIASALGFLGGSVTLFLSSNTKLSRATAILLLVATAYSLLIAFAKKLDPAIKALVGFGTVLSCILLAAIYYFDKTLEMNAPVKLSAMIGLLAVMLYHTAELRCLLDKATPRLHRALSVILLSIGALSAIPFPVAMLLGKFDQTALYANAPLLAQAYAHPEYLASAWIILGACLTVAIRLWGLMIATEEEI